MAKNREPLHNGDVAIYHFSAKTVSRAEGRSSTAAAAYRSGELIADARTGEIHDYTRKAGVVAGEVVIPGGSTMPRSALWNAVEAAHKRKDSVVAREFELAIPNELSAEQQHALLFEYGKELANEYGVAVDWNIHEPSSEGDERNTHAHVLMSACYVSNDGVCGKKAVELDPIHCARAKIENSVEVQRKRWQEVCNVALELAGQSARIDHRTLEAQGITDRLPDVHLGPVATAIQRQGDQSEIAARAKRNADEYISKVTADAAIRQAAKRDIQELEAEIFRLKNEIEIEEKNERLRSEFRAAALKTISSNIHNSADALRRAHPYIQTANRNLEHALSGAKRRQHRRHFFGVATAISKFLGTLGSRLEKIIDGRPKTPKTLDEIWALQQQADADRKAARKEFDQANKDANYWPSIRSERAITQAQHDQWRAKQQVLVSELQAATKQVQSLEKRIGELPWYKFKTELQNQLESLKQKESRLQKAEHEARSIIALPIKEHVEAQEKEAAERRDKGQAALAAAQEKLARAEERYREIDQARMDQIDLERTHDSVVTHRPERG